MEFKPLYTAAQIARRVRELGRAISRDYRDQPLDLMAVLENSFVFAADLVRRISSPVRCHFIRAEIREGQDLAGYARKEIFYTPEFDAAGKNILLVDGVLHSGVTLDFLVKRIGLSRPKSIKTAVLVDKPAERKVALEPDYYGFRLASNQMVVGYGLAQDGLYRNLPYVAVSGGRKAGRGLGRRRLSPTAKPVRRGKARKR